MLDLGLTPDLIDAEDDGRYGLAGGDSRNQNVACAICG
jgi:hypothetical protein